MHKRSTHKCELGAGCKNSAYFHVEHKFGERKTVNACYACASKIGAKTEDGPLINLPGGESGFYKISKMPEFVR